MFHNQISRMPLIIPSQPPIAYGDDSLDIYSCTSDSSPDLTPAEECIELETFDLSRFSINPNLDLTSINPPLLKDSELRRSTEFDLSLLDLSRCESYLYDDFKQELQNITLESQQHETEVISYDSFLAKINDSDYTISNASPHLQLKQFEIPTELPKPKLKPIQDLKYFKEQALLREKQRQIKRIAAVRIQAWYRARQIRRIYKPLLDRFLEDRRLAILDEIRERLDFIQAALRIQKAIRNFLLRKKQIKAKIWFKYLNMCAEIIQKNWKRYRYRKIYLQSILIVRQKRNLLVTAYVKGWKTRKILQNSILQTINKKILVVDPKARKVLKEEFACTFNMMYMTGSWTNKTKADPKPFLRKSQKDALKPSTTRPTDRSKEIVFLEAKLKNSQEITIPRISESNPYIESAKNQDISSRSKSQVYLVEELTSAQINNKEYLKRKSKQIQMKKVDWAHVNTKIDCWVDKDGNQRNQSEKAHHRRPRSSIQNSNIFPKYKDCSRTARTTTNEILNSPSLKPKHIRFAHSPISHTRLVSMKSPRLSITPDLVPLTSSRSRSRIRLRPIRGKNTLLHLNDIEKQYEDAEAQFKLWCCNLISDTIPKLCAESVFFLVDSEFEILERMENLRVEYDSLCNN